MSETLRNPDSLDLYRNFVDNLPTGRIDYIAGSTGQQEYDLGIYAHAGYRSDSTTGYQYRTEQPEHPPFPEGFPRSYYLDTVGNLMSRLGANAHFYRRAEHPSKLVPLAMQTLDQHRAHSERKTSHSLQWEQLYARHIRQRHQFHLAFLEFAAGQSDIPPREAFERITAESVLADVHRPSADIVSKIAAGELHNYAEWAAHSTLNVLLTPPQEISASIQQRALQIFGEHVTPGELTTIDRQAWTTFLRDTPAQAAARRLPASFLRAHEELSATQHDKWWTNVVIVEFFGARNQGTSKPFAAGCNQLLLERPGDLMQVLMLNISGEYDNRTDDVLRALHHIGNLPQGILNRVVNENASYRAVYNEAHTIYELEGQQLGTWSVAEQTDDPAALKALLRVSQARIADLGADIDRLETVIASNVSTMATMQEELNVRRLRQEVHPLFARHGINMDSPDEVLLYLVGRMRHHYGRQFHPDQGKTPDEERLKALNAELDQILRLRGLKQADEAAGMPDVDQ